MPATAAHHALSRYVSTAAGPGQMATPNVVSNAKTARAVGSPSWAARMRVMVDLVTPDSLASVLVDCLVFAMAWRRFSASVAANCWACSSLICMALSLVATTGSCRNRGHAGSLDNGPKDQTTVENLIPSAEYLRPAPQTRSRAECMSALLSLAVL